MLNLIIAESALELVPSRIVSHPSVSNHAKRLGKNARELLLDRSYHHAAMRNLPDAYRRGRPDIIHITLMNAISTPLFMEDKMSIFAHTRDDYVITVGRGARLPKSYPRFVSLMEQLFQQKSITSEGNVLLRIEQKSFAKLIKTLKPKAVIGMSRIGKEGSFEGVAKILHGSAEGAVVVGGFPRGHFKSGTVNEMDQILSVHELPLEAHVVVARLIYEIEKISDI